jgi:HEAT repeat protein
MNSLGLLDVAAVGLASTGALLLIVLVALRIRRQVRRARAERAAEPYRARLLELLCAEGDDRERVLGTLAELDDRSWTALEPVARTFLGKVTGQASGSLVELFERRGLAERAMADLERPGRTRRARAAETLGRLRHQAAAQRLLPLLQDPDPDVRVVAAKALGRIGDPGAVSALLAALHGPNPIPPPVVVLSLTELGPDSQPAVAAGLDARQPLVRAVAVEALGAVGASAWAPRIALALTADPHPEVQIRAARALGALGTPPAADPLLDALKSSRPAPLRAVAAGALGRLGDPGMAWRLGELLDDPVPRVAATAARSMARLGQAGEWELRRAQGGIHGERAARHADAALAEAAISKGRTRSASRDPAVDR